MALDPNVWLSQQPGFVAVAEALGRGPLEFAREYREGLTTVETEHVTMEHAPVQLPYEPPLADRRQAARLDEIERRLKRHERHLTLLRDDLDMSLLES